jgi:DNA polymerase-3 subunit delta'
VPNAEVSAALRREGIPSELAEAAAEACGGDLHRARLLARDPGLAGRRRSWTSVRSRLDGTGSTACGLADELLAGIDEVLAPLEALQREEISSFDEMAERLGGGRKGERSALEARHKREARRVRTDELRAGLAAMLEAYREPLDGLQPSSAASSAFLEAAGGVQRFSEALRFNPNEPLALWALLLALPR